MILVDVNGVCLNFSVEDFRNVESLKWWLRFLSLEEGKFDYGIIYRNIFSYGRDGSCY